MSAARRVAIDAPDRAERPQEPVSGVLRPGATTDGSAIAQGRSWRFWFSARMGPSRKRTKTVNGVRITHRSRGLELPPSPNDRLHHQARARLVKDWRESVSDHIEAGIGEVEPVRQARISVVMHRERLGISDPDNDMARCKPILDGMRDAGLLLKDTYGAVEFGFIGEKRADQRGVGVDVLVTEIVLSPAAGLGQEG